MRMRSARCLTHKFRMLLKRRSGRFEALIRAGTMNSAGSCCSFCNFERVIGVTASEGIVRTIMNTGGV